MALILKTQKFLESCHILRLNHHLKLPQAFSWVFFQKAFWQRFTFAYLVRTTQQIYAKKFGRHLAGENYFFVIFFCYFCVNIRRQNVRKNIHKYNGKTLLVADWFPSILNRIACQTCISILSIVCKSQAWREIFFVGTFLNWHKMWYALEIDLGSRLRL